MKLPTFYTCARRAAVVHSEDVRLRHSCLAVYNCHAECAQRLDEYVQRATLLLSAPCPFPNLTIPLVGMKYLQSVPLFL